MLGFGFQVSGVGRKGERSGNQELDPLEKTLGHKVAEPQRHRQVDKKSALFKNPSFSVPLWALTPDTWNLTPETREPEQKRDNN